MNLAEGTVLRMTLSRGQAVHFRHGDIHHDDVRPKFLRGSDQGLAVGHGSHHVILVFQKAANAVEKHWMVVRQQKSGPARHVPVRMMDCYLGF